MVIKKKNYLKSKQNILFFCCLNKYTFFFWQNLNKYIFKLLIFETKKIFETDANSNLPASPSTATIFVPSVATSPSLYLITVTVSTTYLFILSQSVQSCITFWNPYSYNYISFNFFWPNFSAPRMVSGLINANPVIYEKKQRQQRSTQSLPADEYTVEPIDQQEIFDILFIFLSKFHFLFHYHFYWI